MRSTELLCSVAVITLLTSQAAFAQTAASDAPAAQATPNEVATVTVTGIRHSLDAAIAQKREADVVVDVIAPEDLGKFSDVSIADSLQRVSGVEIERNDGGIDGDRVSIRGLGPQFVETTLNGRVPVSFGSGGQLNLREFNFDVIPSEILTQVTVYKTSSAELVDPGLAGEVDMQTLRPLDFKYKDGKNYYASVSVRGQEQSFANTNGYRVSGVASGRFLNDTLGLYAAAVIADEKTRTDEMYVQSFGTHDLSELSSSGAVQTFKNVVTPDEIRLDSVRPAVKRTAVSTGLQWKPTQNFEVNIDYTLSDYETDDNRNQLSIYDSNVWKGVAQPGGYTISPHGLLEGYDTSRITPGAGVTNPVQFQILDFPFKGISSTQIGGVNLKWKTDRFEISSDSSYSSVVYNNNLPTGFTVPQAYSGAFSFSGSGSAPRFNTGSADLTNPAGAIASGLEGFYFQWDRTRGDSFQQRLDAKYQLTDNIKLKVGARYALTQMDVRFLEFHDYFNPDYATTPYIGTPQAVTDAKSYFTGGVTHVFPGENIGLNSYASACYACLEKANPTLYNYYPLTGFSGSFSTANARSIAAGGNYAILNPDSSYLVRESSLSFYTQVDAHGTIFGVPFRGNAGVRVVRNHDFADGLSAVYVYDPVSYAAQVTDKNLTDQNAYTKVLPSLNVDFKITKRAAIRFGYSSTISPPDFSVLAPRGEVYLWDTSSPGYDPNIDKNATSATGNTHLKPTFANSFDLTGEYYAKGGGFFYGSLFYKRVYDFSLLLNVGNGTLPGYGSTVFASETKVENVNPGTIKGAEIGFHEPFKFLPGLLRFTGVQASYTYIDSAFDNPASHPELAYGFPGSSRNNENLILYYDDGRLSARLAGSFRSSYFSQVAGQDPRRTQPLFTEGTNEVAFTGNYEVWKGTTITFAATNLLGSNRRDFSQDANVFYNYFERPRTYSLAVRQVF